MRSTHELSVEVLAGLHPIRHRLSFLNERFLVSALVKPNDLRMLKLDELYWIWNNSNCLPEWQIVRESRMVSRTHFLTESNIHLVDLKFVRIGWRELQGPTAIYTDEETIDHGRSIGNAQYDRVKAHFWIIWSIDLIKNQSKTNFQNSKTS
jgi:hypothetical protein